MTGTTIRVESELPLRSVTFPARLDHSWAFATSAVHARPFRLQADDSPSPEAVTFERLDETVFRVAPCDAVRWTDERCVTTSEIERCLSRGRRILEHDLSFDTERDGATVVVRSDMGEEALRWVLSSAVFALTPDIRDDAARATSGPYRITDITDGGNRVTLRARLGCRAVHLVSTASPEHGRALLRSGQLDLTRVIGGRRGAGWPGSDRSLTLTMGLRSSPSGLARTVAGAVDASVLATATDGSYSPADDAPVIALPQLSAGGLRLSYAEFFPNGQVASSIAEQLPSWAGSVLSPVPYDRYLAADLSEAEIRIEIVEPIAPCRTAADFVPLLRANTTCDAGPKIIEGPAAITARGEVLWDVIQMNDR